MMKRCPGFLLCLLLALCPARAVVFNLVAPPDAVTGETAARRPLINTNVARLRSETAEPPLDEPEEMLPLSEPMLFAP